MNFGDWELFRVCILALREKEREYQQRVASNVNSFQTSASGPQGVGAHLLDVDFDGGRLSRSSSLRSNTAFTGTAQGYDLKIF